MRVVTVLALLLLAGCTGPSTTPPTTSPPLPNPQVFAYSTLHPPSNLTLQVDIRGLPPGGNCTYSEAYSQWADAPVLSFYYKMGAEVGDPDWIPGGWQTSRGSHVHASPLGIDTREPWDMGEQRNHSATVQFVDDGQFLIGAGGLVPDTLFHAEVTCPAPAVPRLLAMGKVLDLVESASMTGGVGFTFYGPVPGSNGASDALDHYEATYPSERLWLLITGGYGNQYAKLDLSGAITRSYVIQPNFSEEVTGTGGHLRFDLDGWFDAPNFSVVVVGLDSLPPESEGDSTHLLLPPIA